jgi:hypothetical protein
MGRLIDGQELVDSFLTFLPPDTVTNMVTLTPRSSLKAADDKVSALISTMMLHPLWEGKWNPRVKDQSASLRPLKVYESQEQSCAG